ncbi:MAG: hypothetical protein V1748_03185 [Actinomycetota bacterium]
MFLELRISKKTMSHVASGHPEITREIILDAFYDEYSIDMKVKYGRRSILCKAEGGTMLTIIGRPEGTTLHMVTARPMSETEKTQYRRRRK